MQKLENAQDIEPHLLKPILTQANRRYQTEVHLVKAVEAFQPRKMEGAAQFPSNYWNSYTIRNLIRKMKTRAMGSHFRTPYLKAKEIARTAAAPVGEEEAVQPESVTGAALLTACQRFNF
jgi:hypothetical protein